MRLFGSQLRANVAEVVAQTLDETAGYEVEDHLYEQLDQRRTLLARLQHANGNEIVVSVAPAAEEPGSCVLRLLNYDYDSAAEEDLDERARGSGRGTAGPGHTTPRTRDARKASRTVPCSTSPASGSPSGCPIRSARRAHACSRGVVADDRQRAPRWAAPVGDPLASFTAQRSRRLHRPAISSSAGSAQELWEHLRDEGFQRIVLTSNSRRRVLP